MNTENLDMKSSRVTKMELEISERDRRWLVGYMVVFLLAFGVCLALGTMAQMAGVR